MHFSFSSKLITKHQGNIVVVSSYFSLFLLPSFVPWFLSHFFWCISRFVIELDTVAIAVVL